MVVVISGGARVDEYGVETLHGAQISWRPGNAPMDGSWVNGVKGRAFFDTPPPRFGRMDPLSKLAVGCAHLARKDAMAGGSKIPPEGMVLGTFMGCLITDIHYYSAVCDQGLEATSPLLFSYTLPNVAVGEVCREFRMFGPNTVISCGSASALAALDTARGWLCAGRASCVLAGGVEAVDARVAELCRGEAHALIRSSAYLFQLEIQDTPPDSALPRIIEGKSYFSPTGFPVERSPDLGNTGMEQLWEMLKIGGQGFRTIQVHDKQGYASQLKIFTHTEKHGSSTGH